MKFDRVQAVLFDWGDTIMRDDPFQTAPMVDWPQVELVAGVDGLLSNLQARGLRLGLATGALVSTVEEIRGALARVQVEQYFEKIYCYSSSGQRKPSAAFYQYILDDLGLAPAEVLMVGDSFENDVQAANRLGMAAVWYNPTSDTAREGALFSTIHSMPELLTYFMAKSNITP